MSDKNFTNEAFNFISACQLRMVVGIELERSQGLSYMGRFSRTYPKCIVQYALVR
jgi:hypothetical protein